VSPDFTWVRTNGRSAAGVSTATGDALGVTVVGTGPAPDPPHPTDAAASPSAAVAASRPPHHPQRLLRART